jgi:hypothetical protein
VSAESLEGALGALGIDCRVEDHERLALVVPRRQAPGLTDPELRRSVVRLAAEHGFTHVALELVEPGAVRATLPGD